MKATQRKAGYAALSIGALLGLAVFSAGFAEPGNEQAAPAVVKRQKTYIVQMASDPIASYQGRTPGLAATKPAAGKKLNPSSPAYKNYAAHLEKLHDQALASVGGGAKVYDYNVVFNGFAAVLTSYLVGIALGGLITFSFAHGLVGWPSDGATAVTPDTADERASEEPETEIGGGPHRPLRPGSERAGEARAEARALAAVVPPSSAPSV